MLARRAPPRAGRCRRTRGGASAPPPARPSRGGGSLRERASRRRSGARRRLAGRRRGAGDPARPARRAASARAPARARRSGRRLAGASRRVLRAVRPPPGPPPRERPGSRGRSASGATLAARYQPAIPGCRSCSRLGNVLHSRAIAFRCQCPDRATHAWVGHLIGGGIQMTVRSLARAAAAAASIVLMTAGAAAAHDVNRLEDDGAVNSGKETHAHDQHGGIEGHLPATRQNVSLIGKLDLFTGAEEPGRIADVSAMGNYAYLAVFREPTCDRGGIQIVDISNPASPKAAGLIPSHLGTYTGEGSQVISLNTKFFQGDLLVYQNEICAGNDKGVGGVTLVDVTNPSQPKKLVEGFGDFSVNGKSQTHSNQVHSAFAWQDGAKAYAVLVDDEEATDVDILDITNPSRPKLISETDLTPVTEQPLGAVHGDNVFLHDMVVKKIN